MAARSDLTSHSLGMPTAPDAGEEEAEGEVVLKVGEGEVGLTAGEGEVGLTVGEGEAVLTAGGGEVVVACVLSPHFKFSALIIFLLQGRGGDRGRGRGGARGGMRTGAIAASEGRKITF